MIINHGPIGKKKSKCPPLFSFTGSYEYRESTAADGTVNWELALMSGGELRFQRVVDTVDLFLVGGGNAGDAGIGNIYEAVGGDGGRGGETKKVLGKAVSAGTRYLITIGGSGGSTTGFGETARAGLGAYGGGGALQSGSGIRTAATAGSGGRWAFDEEHTQLWAGYKYAPGGGGGAARNGYMGYWSAGASGGLGSAGGTPGGGSGGQGRGGAGVANSGGGGAGGASDHINDRATGNCAGGAGGSGIIIIRNAR